MNREGDWMCVACQHVNFKKRDGCQRCSCPKYATSADVAMYGLNITDVWTKHNRLLKFDRLHESSFSISLPLSCGICYCCTKGSPSPKVRSSTRSPRYLLRAYNITSFLIYRIGCGMHNYASRAECYKCKTPMDSGETSELVDVLLSNTIFHLL
nr:uncharacterized protein LOC109119059 [Solanum lycopersicum]